MKQRKPFLVVFTCAMLSAIGAVAQEQEAPASITVPLALSQIQVTDAGGGTAQFTGAQTTGPSSHPALPRFYVRVLLPPDADLSSVRFELADEKTEEVPGEWDVLPAPRIVQGDATTESGDAGTSLERNEAVYATDAFLPPAFAGELITQTVREWRIAGVRVLPYLYNPAKKALRHLSEAKVVFTFERLPDFKRHKSKSPTTAALFRDRVRRMVVNFAEAAREYDSAMP